MSNQRHSRGPIADPRVGRDPFDKLPPLDARELRRLLKHFKIGNDWEVLIFGDGSGSKWGYGIGFAAISFDRWSSKLRPWYGAMNDGTNNLAEMLAYLAPLMYYASEAIRAKEDGAHYGTMRVRIFTDSQYCRDTGTRGCAMRGKNFALWDCLASVRHVGVIPTWHWIRRETTAFNSLVDRLSKSSRLAVQNIQPG